MANGKFCLFSVLSSLHFGLIKEILNKALISIIYLLFLRFRVEQQKNTLLMEKNEMTVAVDDLTMEKVRSF